MQIAELHEAAGRIRMKIELRDAQPVRLGETSVEPGRGGQGSEA
jgi:hypothetical protein